MKILIIDLPEPLLIVGLEELGHELTDGSIWSPDTILKEIGAYHGIILRSRISVDEKLLAAAVNLKFIAREGAGVEHIDMSAAERLRIPVLTANEGNRDAVAEHAIGMLLSLMNNINKADAEVRNGLWKREANRGIELHEKKVAIIGYGNMGTAMAEKLSGFGCSVYYYDKFPVKNTKSFAHKMTMEKIYDQADIVSLHLPLTMETTGLVNDEYLNKFTKNIILVNTSRGKIVNTDDLVKNMKSGKVIGACLDVLAYENQSFTALTIPENRESYDYLMGSNRVILTPHIAGWSHESKKKIAIVLLEKIKAITKE